MKRLFCLSLGFLLLSSVAVAQESWVPDPRLQEAVRRELQFSGAADFTRADLLELDRLDLYQLGVEDLTGLEHAKHLTWFSFAENDVSDLSPLLTLRNLQTLYGWSNKHIVDISPIANLTALRSLNLAGCNISEIAAIAHLTRLENLNLSYNGIQNIEPLAGLTQLIDLRLQHNKIVDVRPLATLHGLEKLHIDNNRIDDFSALAGLGLIDFIFDEVCRVPPFSIDPDIRFENRSYPSIFQAWSDVINRQDLSKSERLALHDLYWAPNFQLDFRETDKGMQLVGNIEAARHERYALSQINPNIIVLAEIAMRDEWPRSYPDDWPHWIRDENGNRVSAIGYPAFLMDFTHPEVPDIMVEQAIAVRKCGLYDGIFIDWWNEKGTVLWTEFTKLARTNAAEQHARDVIIRRLRAAVGADFLIMVNHNRQKAERAAPYINGLFMETGKDDARGYTHQGLQQLEETLLWAETTLRVPRINALEGQGINAQPPASEGNLRNMRLITTLSLTHSDGYVLYNLGIPVVDTSVLDHVHFWTEFWEPKLGRPIGAKAETYKNINGLFIREFTNGFAVYNRSGKERMLQFPEKVSGVASGVGKKRWHTIPDLDGEIYLKAGDKLETLWIQHNFITDVRFLQSATFDVRYDEICEIPGLPIRERITSQSKPSFFLWGKMLNRQDLSETERFSLADLYMRLFGFDLRFRFVNGHWQLVGLLDEARSQRDALLAENPNLIFLHGISFRTEFPGVHRDDWEHWIRDENGERVPVASDYYTAYLIDFTHPEVQDMIVAQAIAIRNCGLYDGIFFDWWNENAR